jgi:hypothetical protein
MAVSVRFDPDVERKLEAAAIAQGVSKSEYIRRCVAQELDKAPIDRAKLAWELGKDVFGKYGSGRSDGSENDEKILDEMFDAKRRDR